jgi:hypothetical protein
MSGILLGSFSMRVMLLQKEPRRQEHVFVIIDDQDFARSVIHTLIQ